MISAHTLCRKYIGVTTTKKLRSQQYLKYRVVVDASSERSHQSPSVASEDAVVEVQEPPQNNTMYGVMLLTTFSYTGYAM